MSALDLSKFSKSAQAAIHRICLEASKPDSFIALVVLSHACIESELTVAPAQTQSVAASASAVAEAGPILPSHIASTLKRTAEMALGDYTGRCAPRSLSTGITLASSNCVVVPREIKFAKLNWGVLGAVTQVDFTGSRLVQVEEDDQGNQPNRILHLLQKCVRVILQRNPQDDVDALSKKMQATMKTTLLTDITSEVAGEISLAIEKLEDLRVQLNDMRQKKPSKASITSLLEKFDSAVKEVQVPEQLKANLEQDRLFNCTLSSPSSRPCMLNKVFMRSCRDEEYPGPDWHITALSRNGETLVANIIQRIKQGKKMKTVVSKQWPLGWDTRGLLPTILPSTQDDWNMDVISLVAEWKRIKIIEERTRMASLAVGLTSGKAKKKSNKIYDEFNVTTQDILLFLRDCGIHNVIMVDGSCNVFASPDDILFCDPEDVKCAMCKHCGNSISDHPHGGTKRAKRAKRANHTKRMRTKPKQN
jgi:hypothetical protein